MLLGDVAQSLKPVKLLTQKLLTFFLFRDRGGVAQQCWIRLHSSSKIVEATHTNCTHGLQSLVGCILPTRYCRFQHCWELLCPFARSMMPLLITLSFVWLDLQCFDFSHEKLEKSVGDINPMLEFMPHSTSGSPFTLSHPSNHFHPTTPSPSTSDPLQFLLEALSKMPLLKDGNSEATAMSSNQRHTEGEQVISPSPVPKSIGSIKRESRKKPSSEYNVAMRHYEDIVNSLFNSFKRKYKKTYVSKQEHETRKDIYRHNMR